MTNSDRKIPEYMGRSVSYQSPHHRGWRKKKDRYLHRKDRKELNESVLHDSTFTRNQDRYNYFSDKESNVSIKSFHQNSFIKGFKYDYEENFVNIPDTITDKNEYKSFYKPCYRSKQTSLSKIPSIFIDEMNNIKIYWEKMEPQEKLKLFSFENKEREPNIIYNELKNIIDSIGYITDEEFIAFSWQYACLTNVNIMTQIKRLARRGTVQKFIKNYHK